MKTKKNQKWKIPNTILKTIQEFQVEKKTVMSWGSQKIKI